MMKATYPGPCMKASAEGKLWCKTEVDLTIGKMPHRFSVTLGHKVADEACYYMYCACFSYV